MPKKKKTKPEKDGSRTVLVDGKDKKRIAELQQEQMQLKTALQTNGQVMQFIFKDYAKKGEQFTGYNMDTGNISFVKAPKPKPETPPKEE